MNKVQCPYCGREHSILRKDGELRERIHCRCKHPKYKYHREIYWLAGCGYICDDDEFLKSPIACL